MPRRVVAEAEVEEAVVVGEAVAVTVAAAGARVVPTVVAVVLELVALEAAVPEAAVPAAAVALVRAAARAPQVAEALRQAEQVRAAQVRLIQQTEVAPAEEAIRQLATILQERRATRATVLTPELQATPVEAGEAVAAQGRAEEVAARVQAQAVAARVQAAVAQAQVPEVLVLVRVLEAAVSAREAGLEASVPSAQQPPVLSVME